jgi:YegS/Rv2252/BmrU family lipid kinase
LTLAFVRSRIRVNYYAVTKTVVVVNPLSQNGALGRRWPEVSRVLRRELGSFEHLLTAGPRDATRLTREALRGGADTVVAIGGDGTIHEVANGFFEDGDGARPVSPGAALAVLPYGTGGDFRKTAGVPKDLAAAAAIIKARHVRPIDVGILEYRQGGHAGEIGRCVFVNIASFGISGVVDQIVNTSSKWMGGKLSFFLATARATLRYKNQRVRLVFDDNDDDALHLTINSVAVANGRYFGGGMFIAPKAELDDGLFDIVAIGDMGLGDLIANGGKVYKGTHLDHPKIVSRRARRLEAHPEDAGSDVLLDVDGEAPGALPAVFTVVPRALPVIVPHG